MSKEKMKQEIVNALYFAKKKRKRNDPLKVGRPKKKRIHVTYGGTNEVICWSMAKHS